MFDILFKKKVTEDQLANYFVNSVFQLIEEGFADVAAVINTDSTFVKSPEINPDNSDEFLMIVIAGNLKYMSQQFNDYQDVRLIDLVTKKFANALGLSHAEMKTLIGKYQSYFSRINHPSKNTHYAMSKAFFFKYNLNCFQEEYFKHMQTPNPVFLKHLDDIMENFIWDWSAFKDKYRIVQ
ncbi:MAG: hypothetical protein CL843_05555 [Crocinitomicaceae bacterium]|nr:hypothetical protein [Crocinitomicaceae bacterium]|tara:strand:+ start:41 stop:583 length:543 start_codon:yes stop_codon:yes gene_type:complete